MLDFDDSAMRPLLTLMHGSPQRAPFPAFQPDLLAVQPLPITGVAMGHFGGSGGVADLFSIAKAGSEVKVWLDGHRRCVSDCQRRRGGRHHLHDRIITSPSCSTASTS